LKPGTKPWICCKAHASFLPLGGTKFINLIRGLITMTVVHLHGH